VVQTDADAVGTSADPTALPAAPVAERLPSEPEAIFIVGVARSGTTMMRYLLETSERMAIARENHYMGHYFGRRGTRHFFRQAGDPADDASIRRIVEMLYSGEYQRHSRWRNVSPFWRWMVEWVPRDEVERRLLAAERSERGLFRAFLRLYADARGRPVMGEKTPAHLAYVDTLLEWFPGGKVVHMMRDPRAVYVSDRHRRLVKARRPYSWLRRVPPLLSLVLLTQTALIWRSAARRNLDYERRYPDRYRLVRFEDLVQQTELTLAGVFDFLGVAMPADLTVERVYAHGLATGAAGVDAEAASRWRGHIHPIARRLLSFFLGGAMRRYGYGK
jgi:hypothetical protein